MSPEHSPDMAAFDSEATWDKASSKGNETEEDCSLRMQIDHAAIQGDLGTIVQILENVAKETPKGERHPLIQQLRGALSTAVESRRHDIADYLIGKGVIAEPSHGRLATINRDVAMLELLLQGGWDINEKIAWDDPPAFGRAVEDDELTDWFLLNGADPNARCGVDLTPLSIAVRDAPLATIRKLFEHGGSVASGQLLHHAVMNNVAEPTELIKYLVGQGSRINAIMYQSCPQSYDELLGLGFTLGTPLHEAAERGNLTIVRTLVAIGADASIRDSRGDLAEDRAQNDRHMAVSTFLRSLPASPVLARF
ncbi:hypothetical protein LTR91_012032 [Friedmanniomyces endolithicus]|uniref:Uncharacterized protein n=1 Tax=Friedmanniomyces endolithicus TaxID=329885 RepID=A0AAN6KGG3_9PEZI|nr:hypothetical protein LTR91_012032 [Friedmanniomyces endolithicus]